MTAAAVPEEIDIGFAELPSGAAATTYKFDEEFQAKIAALCIRDTTFMQRVEGLVRPEYFENAAEGALVPYHQSLLRQVQESYWRQEGAGNAGQGRCHQQDSEPEMAAAAVRRLNELFEHDISDRDLVADQVAVFARHQAVSKAILDSVEHLDLNEFDKISTTLKKALDVGEHSDGELLQLR